MRNPAGTAQCGHQARCGLDYQERLPFAATHPHRPYPDRVDEPFCGGDFRHGGIIRRNVVEYGLRGLGATDAQTRAALLNALEADFLL